MPKLKQPATLEELAVQALGRAVRQRAVEAIASGVNINTSALQDYLYGELPDVLSQEVTAHMLAEVSRTLTNEDCFTTDVSDVTRSVLLGVVYHGIRVLDLGKAPSYAAQTLSSNMQTFTKLQTLFFPYNDLAADVLGLSSLKFLLHFEMPFTCTDAIVETISSSCFATIQHIDIRHSKKVTDACFKALFECRKLRHISIIYTSMTAEGFVQFLKDKKADDTAKDIVGLAVGLTDRSSTHLSVIALCCPILKQLETYAFRADMEGFVSLTTLTDITLIDGRVTNLDGFLRVRGSNITSFELIYTESIDLACIVNHCVNIRRLCISCGSIIMGNMGNAPEACQNLKTLSLSCKFSPPSIEGMLYACVNLTSLCLEPSEERITDELMLRVLSRNPLQKLTTFTASYPEFTMRSVDAMIQQCPLLEELRCYDCRAITAAEVEVLLHKIKTRNQNLKILFTFKIEM